MGILRTRCACLVCKMLVGQSAGPQITCGHCMHMCIYVYAYQSVRGCKINGKMWWTGYYKSTSIGDMGMLC